MVAGAFSLRGGLGNSPSYNGGMGAELQSASLERLDLRWKRLVALIVIPILVSSPLLGWAYYIKLTGSTLPSMTDWLNSKVNNRHKGELIASGINVVCSDLNDPSLAGFVKVKSCTPGLRSYLTKTSQVEFDSDTRAKVTYGEGWVQFVAYFHRDAHWNWKSDGMVAYRN